MPELVRGRPSLMASIWNVQGRNTSDKLNISRNGLYNSLGDFLRIILLARPATVGPGESYEGYCNCVREPIEPISSNGPPALRIWGCPLRPPCRMSVPVRQGPPQSAPAPAPFPGCGMVLHAVRRGPVRRDRRPQVVRAHPFSSRLNESRGPTRWAGPCGAVLFLKKIAMNKPCGILLQFYRLYLLALPNDAI